MSLRTPSPRISQTCRELSSFGERVTTPKPLVGSSGKTRLTSGQAAFSKSPPACVLQRRGLTHQMDFTPDHPDTTSRISFLCRLRACRVTSTTSGSLSSPSTTAPCPTPTAKSGRYEPMARSALAQAVRRSTLNLFTCLSPFKLAVAPSK